MSLKDQVDGITDRIIAKADKELKTEIANACVPLDEIVTEYIEINERPFSLLLDDIREAIFKSRCEGARCKALQKFLAAVESFERYDASLQAHKDAGEGKSGSSVCPQCHGRGYL